MYVSDVNIMASASSTSAKILFQDSKQKLSERVQVLTIPFSKYFGGLSSFTFKKFFICNSEWKKFTTRFDILFTGERPSKQYESNAATLKMRNLKCIFILN